MSAVETATTHSFSTLANDSTLQTNFNNTLVNFCQTNGFTGIELDFEHRGGWTSQSTLYNQLKTVITSLGNALHAAGLKLMIDGPAFTAQNSISWTWSDFNSLPVDYVCPLAYDNFYDTLTGSSASPGPDYAQSPVAWLTNVITFMKSQINNINQIVIAVCYQAYYNDNDDTNFTNVSENVGVFGYNDASGWTGFSGATRDPYSGEMMWTNGGKTYVYCDHVTSNYRLQVCLMNGIQNIDFWFIGSANQWPTVFPATATGGGGGTSSGSIVLTNAGLNVIRDSLLDVLNAPITYVAIGTGTTTPTVNDTKLAQETFRKEVTNYAEGASIGEAIITMYLAPSDAVNTTIQEVGFFGGIGATSTVNSGILIARGLYQHTHKNTELIQFSLNVTL